MVDFGWFRRRRWSQQQWQNPNRPLRERHYLSIVAGILSCAALIASLALKNWAYTTISNSTGSCTVVFSLTTISVTSPLATSGQNTWGLHYYSTIQQVLMSCVLCVSVLTVLSLLVAVVISAGYPRERADFLRQYAVFNIVALLCIVLVAGLWLAVVETLPSDWNARSSGFKEKCPMITKPIIHFGYAYYVYLGAGLFSLTAAAFNLLCSKSMAERRRMMRRWFNRQQRAARAASRPPPPRPRAAVSNESPPAYTLIDTSDFTSDGESAPSDTDARASERLLPPPPYVP